MKLCRTIAFGGVEKLEQRRLLAGNVEAFIFDGSLEIWGDNVANDIIVDQTDLEEGQVRISSGSNATRINGLTTAVVLEGFTGDMLAWLRHGPDRLEIRDMVIPGTLTIKTGLGIDNVSLFNVVVEGDSDIRTGVRPDTLDIDDSTFNGSVFIDMRRGRDTVRIEQSGDEEGPRTFFNGPVEINLGGGDDRLRLGLDANSGNRTVFYNTLLTDGGEHIDELIAGDGNWYDYEPEVLNYEFNNIEFLPQV